MKGLTGCLLFMAAILVCLASPPTTIDVFFEYDSAGNRTQRYISTQKISENDDLLANIDFITTTEKLEDDIPNEHSFKVFPNPTFGLVNIEAEPSSNSSFSIQLFDLNGRLLISERNIRINKHLDLRDFNRGTYLLILQVEGKNSIYKIIKQ
jgi:hypothetical protein